MQPTPQVTTQDVDRIVKRDFPSINQAEIHAILAVYGAESFHREVDRVRLAALKLASGNVSRLRSEIDAATHDYRDTLAAAEYPQYSKKTFQMNRLSAETRRKIVDSDSAQYDSWLQKT